MPRNVAATVALAAGTWVQFGPGWALLALGGLLYAGVPSEAQARAAAAGAIQAAVRAWRSVAGAPRRALAATGMAGGLVMVPAGTTLAAGVGAGLVAAGGLLLAASLLLGWNT